MITVKKLANGKYRIEEGVFIIKDNVDAEKLFDAIEREVRERTGATGAFNIFTTEGEKIR